MEIRRLYPILLEGMHRSPCSQPLYGYCGDLQPVLSSRPAHPSPPMLPPLGTICADSTQTLFSRSRRTVCLTPTFPLRFLAVRAPRSRSPRRR